MEILKSLLGEGKLKGFFNHLSPYFIFIILIIIFYFQVIFFFDQYIQWGNFYTPYSKAQLFSSYGAIFWDRFTGIPNPFAATTLENTIMYNWLIGLLSKFLSIALSMRIYIVLTSFFVISSFYIFTSQYSNNLFKRLVVSIFFFFNPLQMNQLVAGDFLSFWYEGFLILSIFFLISGVRNKCRFNLYWFFSFVFFYLTIGQEQFFYLGILLFLVFFIVEYFKHHSTNKGVLKTSLELFMGTGIILFTIFLLAFPLILPILFGSYINLGPHSTFAQPLSEYSFFSTNPFNILLLKAYPSIMGNIANISMSKFSVGVELVWEGLFDAIVLSILIFSIVKKSFATRTFAFVIIVSSILGGGPHSFLGSIPVFLYLHLPGYQLLNTSYFWAWVIISPLYSLLLIIMLEDFSLGYRKLDKTLQSKANFLQNKLLLIRYFKKLRLQTLLSLIVLIIILLPISSQGYYNTYNGNGIINKGTTVPNSYASLSEDLYNLTANNNGGVAFFPPGPQIYNSNMSDQFVFAYANFHSFKELDIPSYGNLPGVVPDFNLFLYNLIYGYYGNQTINVGMLMAYSGIRYIVALNNMTQYGYNNFHDSKIQLEKMNGLSLIQSSEGYTIFESKYAPLIAEYSNNISIAVGNDFSLVELANNGYNLTYNPLVFLKDLNQSNSFFLLNKTSNIFLQSSSDISYLALKSTPHLKDVSSKFIRASLNHNSSPSEYWVNGSLYYVPEISQLPTSPNNFVFTNSNSSLNFNLTTSKLFNEILLQLYFSNVSKNIEIYANGVKMETVDTHIKGNSNAGFRLIPLKLNTTGNINITLVSRSLNEYYIEALGAAYLVNNRVFNERIGEITSIGNVDFFMIVNYYQSVKSPI